MYPRVPVPHPSTTYPGTFKPYLQHLYPLDNQKNELPLHSWFIPYGQKFPELHKRSESTKFHKQAFFSDEPYFAFKRFYRNNGKVHDFTGSREFLNPFKHSFLLNDPSFTFNSLYMNDGQVKEITGNPIKESENLDSVQTQLIDDYSLNELPQYEVREHNFGKSNPDNGGINNHQIASNNFGGRVIVFTRKATNWPFRRKDDVKAGSVISDGNKSNIQTNEQKSAPKVLVVRVGGKTMREQPTVGTGIGQHLHNLNQKTSDIASNAGLPVKIDLFNDVFANTLIDQSANEETVYMLNGEESVLDKVNGLDSVNSILLDTPSGTESGNNLLLDKVSGPDDVKSLVAAKPSIESQDIVHTQAINSPTSTARIQFLDVESKSKLDNDLSNAVVQPSVSTVNPFLEPMEEMGAFGPGPYYKCHPPSRVVCGANSDWYHVIGIREWCQQNCVVDNYSNYCDDDRCSCQCVQAF